MEKYLNKLDSYISEIKKILSIISVNDVNTNTISGVKLIESWLDKQIKGLVKELCQNIKSPESMPEVRADNQEAIDNKQNINKPIQQEMSSMAASGINGVSGGIDLGTDEEELKTEEDEIENQEDSLFLKEGTLYLRKIIRNTIQDLYKNKNKINLETLLEEISSSNISSNTDKKIDTGMSLANELFPQISSIVEKQYSLLKTNEAQRQAYVEQLLKALEIGFQDLQTKYSLSIAGGNNNIQTKLGDKNDQETFNTLVDIPNIDPTGKSFAIQSYKAVFPKISIALNGEPPQFGLTDENDRKSFIQTIITKVKEICESLEHHMSQQNKPLTPPPSELLSSQPSAKTNADSNFLMP